MLICSIKGWRLGCSSGIDVLRVFLHRRLLAADADADDDDADDDDEDDDDSRGHDDGDERSPSSSMYPGFDAI